MGRHQSWSTSGSILGPLFLLIYINDIVPVIRHSNIRMFADDTCLSTEIDNRQESASKVNSDLTSISNWAKQWLVKFSAPKTKSLIISNKKDAHLNPTIFLDGIPIKK